MRRLVRVQLQSAGATGAIGLVENVGIGTPLAHGLAGDEGGPIRTALARRVADPALGEAGAGPD